MVVRKAIISGGKDGKKGGKDKKGTGGAGLKGVADRTATSSGFFNTLGKPVKESTTSLADLFHYGTTAPASTGGNSPSPSREGGGGSTSSTPSTSGGSAFNSPSSTPLTAAERVGGGQTTPSGAPAYWEGGGSAPAGPGGGQTGGATNPLTAGSVSGLEGQDLDSILHGNKRKGRIRRERGTE